MDLGRREIRRILGYVNATLPSLGLGRVADPRRWHQSDRRLSTLLATVLVGMATGAESLAEVEAHTSTWSRATRRRLGLRGRVPDTTLRDVLARLQVSDLRAVLHRQVHAAHRRKALTRDVLPIGMLSIDGKATSLDQWDDEYAQRQVGEHHAIGLVRTFTATLVSSRAAPVLDMIPIPPSTNEIGHFATAVSELEAVYGGIAPYTLIAGDSGQTSLDNATHVRQLRDGHVHYLLQFGDNQPTLLAEATRLLDGGEGVLRATGDTTTESGNVVERTIEIVSAGPEGVLDWTHARTFIRVTRTATSKRTEEVTRGTRLYVASLPPERFKPRDWLALVVHRWDVENRSHGVLDRVFREDSRHWVETPSGFLVFAALRRVAQNLLGFFRSVTLRSEMSRSLPWADIRRWLHHAMTTAGEALLAGLRPREEPVVPLG